MSNPLVMDNRFFVLSLILIFLLTLTGILLFPMFGIGMVLWKHRRLTLKE